MDVSYTPDTAIDDPPSADEITLELLMASQTHMGHSTSLWNPMNSRYIFGVRQGIHIISLEATASHLRRAARVVEGVAARAGLILFVGTRKGQRAPVTKAARRTGGCHLFTKWVPGSITNGLQLLKKSVIKPVDVLDRKIPGYEEELVERVAMLKPDLVVCFNPLENKVILHECALHCIPSIGVIDTDADPTTVTYPIPANDDSIRSIDLIAGVLGKAGEKGNLARQEAAKSGQPLLYKSFDLTSIAFTEKQVTANRGSEDAAEKPRRGRRGARDNVAELSRDLSYSDDFDSEEEATLEVKNPQGTGSNN